ncbi:MAG: FISUMP domain-containing protein [Patescibacteria group bacterium]|nr:FISUMP domain-containing protein [Patescibacteria group bacterium]
MRTNCKSGPWETIVFLASIFFLVFFFACCDPGPVLLKPSVSITSVKDVATTEAVIVFSVFTNGAANISLEYFEALHQEVKENKLLSLPDKGADAVSISIPLSKLKPNTSYDFRVMIVNDGGSDAKTGTFKTLSLTKAGVLVKPATEVTRFEATLNATIVPYQPETKVTFSYWTDADKTPKSKTLTTLYQGAYSLEVSVSLSELPLGAKIYYQVELDNQAGIVISDMSEFETFAVIDYDCNLYHTVTIGDQVWLREKLRTTHYANGDPIPNVGSAGNWGDLSTGAYCQYNNDPKNGELYGNLYNFYVGNDERELIIGWATPTLSEFWDLGEYLAGSKEAWKAGTLMMAVGETYWKNPNSYNPPTNSSGFTALGNGAFAENTNNQWVYMDLRESATWWTTTSEGSADGHLVEISNGLNHLTLGRFYSQKMYCGLRLLKKSDK